ncbi:RAD51-like protein 2 [Fistulifera solaris]|uniref:DNA repair protein RAD51 homolog 3 n=1 Tax=Fistulifera solaris TaxID=1519565 RepID=A0A1Z5K7N5_FISSO|nr:RAD51-like protein 2 [Fistulifera solaris]|eukprot:GAX22257.1 RAD51-like protein 2 [Fistulifera solaris]
MKVNKNKQLHTPLSHLPLRPSTQQLFATRGFHSQQEVQESFRSGGLSNLAAELGIALSEAGRIWQELQSLDHDAQKENQISLTNRRPVSAQELLAQRPEGASNIITFCRQIDQMLRGGIPLGELTELAGSPGAGKTQWGMQLAVNARLTSWTGGVQGETCYIDTEGSFSPERCYDMAKALIHHVQSGLGRRRQRHPYLPERWDITPEDILKGIYVIRVHDNAALQATFEGSLPQLLRERAQTDFPIKLVVVDSIAFPVRATPMSVKGDDVEFFVARSRQLTVYANQLAHLAAHHDLAAVAINQMTTKLKDDGGELIPALGESWAHAVTTRLILSHHRGTNERTCTLAKSPRLPAASANYQVTSAGIRGVENSNASNSQASGQKRALEDPQMTN